MTWLRHPTFRSAHLSLAAFLVHGCTTTTAPTPDPHYVLGRPYQVGTVWFYPGEAYDLDETGLAVVSKGSHTPLTTDGEVFDQTALAGSHPTLQLPAIARLTNLANGLQVTIRLNDRGAADRHRLLEITRRTATLLGMTDAAVAPVRLQVLTAESRTAAEALPGAPTLAMTVAPRERVEVAELLPPPGSANGQPLPPVTSENHEASATLPPMRLPEAVIQTAPQPGRLMVRLDSFGEFQYAAIEQAKMRAAGARIVRFVDGRTHQFRVEIGPLPDVAHADAVLDQALASGIPDARIVID